MKHILTVLLLAMAILAGLMMPGLWLAAQDERLETPQTIRQEEPVLEWDPDKGTLQDAAAVTGAQIARRLELFGSDQPVTVPVGTENAEDMLSTTRRAIGFFSMLFETQLEVYDSGAEYELAWFEDGTAFPFWTAYINFNRDCVCLLNFDADSGAVLYCTVNLNGHGLEEFFPDSFQQAADAGSSFEHLIAQRFCDTLSDFMGTDQNTVALTDAPNRVSITFTDSSEQSVGAALYVDAVDGIWFNHA